MDSYSRYNVLTGHNATWCHHISISVKTLIWFMREKSHVYSTEHRCPLSRCDAWFYERSHSCRYLYALYRIYLYMHRSAIYSRGWVRASQQIFNQLRNKFSTYISIDRKNINIKRRFVPWVSLCFTFFLSCAMSWITSFGRTKSCLKSYPIHSLVCVRVCVRLWPYKNKQMYTAAALEL